MKKDKKNLNDETLRENDNAIEEVKPKKKKRSKKYILFYLAGIAFVIYAAFMIINQNIEKKDRTAEYNALNEQVEIKNEENEDLKKTLNLSGSEKKKKIEDIARKDGYVKPGERTIVIVSGD